MFAMAARLSHAVSMQKMRHNLALAAAFVPLASAATPAHAGDKTWEDAGSAVRAALVLAAVGVPAVEGDGDGALQAGMSLGATFLATEGLKQSFPELRPDGSDRRSFPSGHTSISFAAAATLMERQGRDVGIAAHVAAAFVGLSRVEADKHHVHDVLTGAAIGELAGLLLTHKPRENMVIMPWGDTNGGGIHFAMRF